MIVEIEELMISSSGEDDSLNRYLDTDKIISVNKSWRWIHGKENVFDNDRTDICTVDGDTHTVVGSVAQVMRLIGWEVK